MNYGITKDGFNKKDFTVLKEELLTRWGVSFGDVDAMQDGAFGNIADSDTYAHAEFWNVIENVLLNMNPNTASGTNLVRLLALLGMTPLGATNSSVDALCGGDSGMIIPIGSSVARDSIKTTFVTDYETTVNETAVNRFNITVDSGLGEDEEVSLRVLPKTTNQSVKVSVFVDSANGLDTPEALALALSTEIWNNSVSMDISSVEISEDNSAELIITTFSPFRTIGIQELTNTSLVKVWKTIKFISSEAGVFITPPLTVTTIKVGSTGWTDVTNLVSGQTGSDAENDNDIRRRAEKYKQIGSAGTRSAIESKIWQNVDGISNVIVNHNPKDYIDTYGRPPHSLHCVVDGGDDQQIGQIIAENLSAGIETYGRVSVSVVVDWQQDPLVINFDRVNSVFGWVKVIVRSLNPEEVVPVNAEELIRNTIYNDALKDNVLGGDIINQKFVGSTYRAINGLQIIEIQCSITGRPDIDPASVDGLPWSYNPLTYSSGWQNEKVVVAPNDRVEWRDGYNRILVEGL